MIGGDTLQLKMQFTTFFIIKNTACKRDYLYIANFKQIFSNHELEKKWAFLRQSFNSWRQPIMANNGCMFKVPIHPL